MTQNKRDKEKLYVIFFKLLKLETTTSFGRVNLAGIIVMMTFSILYTASDVVQSIIAKICSVIKSAYLKENIVDSYETVNVFEAVIPIFLAFSLCMLLLFFYDKRKASDNSEKNK